MSRDGGVLIHKSSSEHGVVEVVQDRIMRSLYFGSDAKQSAVDMQRPERLVLSYTRAMMAGLLFLPQPRSALVIGLGGGALVRFLLHHFPSCRIDAVEYRPDVVKLAYGYFRLEQDPRLTIHINDGAEFVARLAGTHTHHDLILIDAYTSEGMAPAMGEFAFFADCRDCLDEDGVLSINLWNDESEALQRTVLNLREVFDNEVLLLPVVGRANMIALANPRPGRFDGLAGLSSRAETLATTTEVEFPEYLAQFKRQRRWRWLF